MESTNIRYSGKVTVKKYHNGKLIKTFHIKNNGTAALFNLICNFLAGSSSTSYTVSPLLDVCSGTTSGGFTSILNSLPRSSIPVVQEATLETDNATLTYSFNLYNTNLTSISGTGKVQFCNFTLCTSFSPPHSLARSFPRKSAEEQEKEVRSPAQ